MNVLKSTRSISFSKLYRGAPFAINTTLYTKSDYNEDTKEHLLIKTGENKAVTLDRKTAVHILDNHEVTICMFEKREQKKQRT